MKKALLVSVFVYFGSTAFSQFTYKIKADSVLITNDSCNAELNLENSTRNVKGFLYNKGNGRTEFRRGAVKVPSSDSLYVIGADTINLAAGGSLNAWKLNGNSGTNPATNFLGSTDNNALIFKTNNLERMRIRSSDAGLGGFVGIGTNSPTSLLHLYGVNPTLYFEGDSNSYYGGILIKSNLGTSYMNNYGINDYHGTYIIRQTTGNMSVAIGLLASDGACSISEDSSKVTHKIVSARNQVADIFRVSKNIASGYGQVNEQPVFIVNKDGNMGVSTTIPGYNLDVNGTARINTLPFLASRDTVLTYDPSTKQLKVTKIENQGSSSGWNLTGNAGTNPATNFLGTTDAQRLVFKTNNIEKVVLDSNKLVVKESSTQSGNLQEWQNSSGVPFISLRSGDPNITNLPNIYGANPHLGIGSVGGQTVIFNGSGSYTSFVQSGGGIGTLFLDNTYVNTSGTGVLWKTDGAAINFRNAANTLTFGSIVPAFNFDVNQAPWSMGVVSASTTSGVELFRVFNGPITASVEAGIFGIDKDGNIRANGKIKSAADTYSSGGYDYLVRNQTTGRYEKRAISSSDVSSWSLTGNAGTNPSTNFLGTTDANRLVFRTNNIERATLDTNSRLGIATAAPQYKLDVNGDVRISTLPFLASRDTVLTYDPITKQLKATQPSGTLIGIRVLTSGTSYTPTTGTASISVQLIGGGGGGGGVTGANSNVGAGGGGGSGSYVIKYITGIGAGPYTYAIGAAGTAGANTGGNGGNGGSTTLTITATTYTAPGGSGGVGQTAGTTAAVILGGNGGTAGTNGDVNGAGTPGVTGLRLSGTVGSSGAGASSILGGGANALNTAAAGNAASGFGSGGSGGLSTSNTARTGGAGSAGVIIIYEYR